MDISLKRAYDPPVTGDGFRLLVDRIWPRGVSKDSAHVDLWLKEIAPSARLRKWFGHDPMKWDEFRSRYFSELKANAEPLAQVRALVRKGKVTFVYAAKDTLHNNAVALKEFIEGGA